MIVDREALDFARIYAPGSRPSEPNGAFRLYSQSKPDGWVIHPLEDQVVATVRIIALEPKQWIERIVRLRFDEVRVETEVPPTQARRPTDFEGGKMDETRAYIGDWQDEVKWSGWRLANGYVEADGPFCPVEDAPLEFIGDWHRRVRVEDWQEIRPPDTYLVCPQCERKWYLGATDRKPKRVGTARETAVWRLKGGKTSMERLIDKLPL